MNRLEEGSQADRLLALILEAALREGEFPVYQHLDLNGPDAGIAHPHEVLEAVPGDFLSFDLPLEDASRVSLFVAGIERARKTPLEGSEAERATATVLQAFVNLLVALSERRRREQMLSAARAQPVVVHAHELSAHTAELSDAHLRLLGHILDQERIGLVEFTEDPGSPWNIEIGFEIRAFRSVEDVPGYLRIQQRGRD